jgi:hypothetical protein
VPRKSLWGLLAVVAVALLVRWVVVSGPGFLTDDNPQPDVSRAGDSVSRPLAPSNGTGDRWLRAVDVPGVRCDGDSVDDLQAAVDRAADEGVPLVLPTGATCLLDETLEVPSGLRIEASGATVEGVEGAFAPRPDRESMVGVIGVSDVTITGGVWVMAEDEGANVFEIRDSSDIVLSGLTALGAREDGFYLGPPASEGVTLDGVLAMRNGRSGISITTGRDIHVVDSQAHDNGHVLDMRGLTIEPNSEGGPLTGIRIVNLETSGNERSGAGVSLDNLGADDDDVDIVFERYRSYGEPIGLRVSKGLAGGSLRIVDARFDRTEGVALQLKDRWASAFEVEIIRPVILDWGTDPSGRARHDSAISIYTSDDDADEPLGGVRIVEPVITAHRDAGSEAYYLYVGDNRDEPADVQGVELLDPQRLERGRGLSLDGNVHVGADRARGSGGDRAEGERTGN